MSGEERFHFHDDGMKEEEGDGKEVSDGKEKEEGIA